MAKVYYLMELLERGVRFAETESEKIDLTNQFADFCTNSGEYFDNKEYIAFEGSVMDAIEFGNSLEYNYNEFSHYYENVVDDFMHLKKWYYNIYENNILISFAIQSAGDTEALRRCLDSLCKYIRKDVEIVVLDHLHNPEIKKMTEEFAPNLIRYYESDKENEIEREVELLSKCEGIFVFPIYEQDQYIEEATQYLIEIIQENPHIGAIFCPNHKSIPVLNDEWWLVLAPGNEALFVLKNILYKTGFGYRNAYLDKEHLLEHYREKKEEDNVEALYSFIAYDLCEKYDVAGFKLPIYVKEDENK